LLFSHFKLVSLITRHERLLLTPDANITAFRRAASHRLRFIHQQQVHSSASVLKAYPRASRSLGHYPLPFMAVDPTSWMQGADANF
jgi:hypothetical protein